VIDRKKFFDDVRGAPFPGLLTSIQVDGLTRILDYWEAHRPPDALDTWLGYILATAFHETGHLMQPIEEYGRGNGKPYGASGFYGRGLVQLTWRDNYAKFQDRGIEGLVAHPERALDWDTALLILFDGMINGLFTGHKLSEFFTPRHSDPVNARRVVNGLDKAAQIATYYTAFMRALSDAQAEPPEQPAPIPEPTPPAPPSPPVPPPAVSGFAEIVSAMRDMIAELRAIRIAIEGGGQEVEANRIEWLRHHPEAPATAEERAAIEELERRLEQSDG
jgi:putative chitinase